MTNDEGETVMNYLRVAEPWEDEVEANVVREDAPEQRSTLVYNLEERTARFGETIIDFLKQVPLGPRTNASWTN